MINFYVELINPESVLISAVGEINGLDDLIDKGNGWNYILTFDEIFKLPYQSGNQYYGYFYNENPEAEFIRIGYHNFEILNGPSKVPPSLTDGGLRFTSLPYVTENDFSHIQFLVPGKFGGGIIIKHPNIHQRIHNIGAKGNVFWGPEKFQNGDGDLVESTSVIGTWIVVDPVEQLPQ